MYCSNCGNKLEIDDNFCGNCGNALNGNSEVKIDNKNDNKNLDTSGNKQTSLILGIICLVSSFFLNILCFIPGIISIVYANKYKKESGEFGVGFGLSLGGMIFSFVMFIISIIFVLFFINVANEISTIDVSGVEYTSNLYNL